MASRQNGPGCGQCAIGIDPSRQVGGDANDRTTNDVFGRGSARSRPSARGGVLDAFGGKRPSSLPAPWDCAASSGFDEACAWRSPAPRRRVLCCAD